MRPGDGDLLGLGVARQFDDLEAVPQGRWDPEPLVGRGDEEDLRQVERELDKRVSGAALLFRIEGPGLVLDEVGKVGRPAPAAVLLEVPVPHSPELSEIEPDPTGRRDRRP
ncbi:MAG: hypothetical protein OXH75_26660 [Acidobacteria bacterium]|nr:hypothetical protein [Acidobacteriota bacterium]